MTATASVTVFLVLPAALINLKKYRLLIPTLFPAGGIVSERNIFNIYSVSSGVIYFNNLPNQRLIPFKEIPMFFIHLNHAPKCSHFYISSCQMYSSLNFIRLSLKLSSHGTLSSSP